MIINTTSKTYELLSGMDVKFHPISDIIVINNNKIDTNKPSIIRIEQESHYELIALLWFKAGKYIERGQDKCNYVQIYNPKSNDDEFFCEYEYIIGDQIFKIKTENYLDINFNKWDK